MRQRPAKFADRRAHSRKKKDVLHENNSQDQFSFPSYQLPSRRLYTEAMEVLYGIHAVEEALRAKQRNLDHIEVARDRHDQRLQQAIDLAREAGVSVRFVTRDQLDRLA